MSDLTPKRRVICAANRVGLTLILGARHYDQTMHATIQHLQALGDERNFRAAEQGFIDQFGEFLTREEALTVARAAGQLEGRHKHNPQDQLCSEDIY